MSELEITETLSSIRPYYYKVKAFRDQLPDQDTLTAKFIIDFAAVTSEWFDSLDFESRNEQFITQMSDKVTALEFCCHGALQYINN